MLFRSFLTRSVSQTWVALDGQTTIGNVINAYHSGSSYAPEGPSVEPDGQYIITEENIEVVDILLVSSSSEPSRSHPGC